MAERHLTPRPQSRQFQHVPKKKLRTGRRLSDLKDAETISFRHEQNWAVLKECCCLPLRLPKTHFRHNRHYCHVYHSCTDESVLPTDTNDTVLRGSTANWRNCRNWNRRFRFACKALKHRVLSAKCRIHRDLQIMAVIESLPLRQIYSHKVKLQFHRVSN